MESAPKKNASIHAALNIYKAFEIQEVQFVQVTRECMTRWDDGRKGLNVRTSERRVMIDWSRRTVKAGITHLSRTLRCTGRRKGAGCSDIQFEATMSECVGERANQDVCCMSQSGRAMSMTD